MNGQQFEAGVFLAERMLSKICAGAGRLLDTIDDLFEIENARLNIENITSQLDAIPYSLMKAKTAAERDALQALEIRLRERRTAFENRVEALIERKTHGVQKKNS